MKVPNPPRNGKDTAEAKDGHREVESEERIRQNSGLLHLRLNAVIRLPNKPKSHNCTGLYFIKSVKDRRMAGASDSQQPERLLEDSADAKRRPH